MNAPFRVLDVGGEDLTARGNPADGQADVDHLKDWSGTGKGFHVDFDSTVPLKLSEQPTIYPLKVVGAALTLCIERSLGRGPLGCIQKTIINGIRVTHKQIYVPLNGGRGAESIMHDVKREVEILKRISHIHCVRIVGTYTNRELMGIIYHPVALCDLHTFFDDVELFWSGSAADAASKDRLEALGYFLTPSSQYKATPAYSRIGCITSAVAYLHASQIKRMAY